MATTMTCPCCDVEGTLAEVRAHLVVRADAADDAHRDWLADHGVDLGDDRQPSVPAITEALEIHAYSSGGRT